MKLSLIFSSIYLNTYELKLIRVHPNRPLFGWRWFSVPISNLPIIHMDHICT